MVQRLNYPPLAEALAVVVSHDCSRTKVAELGGDGNDVPFEQAFSNLSHAYLRDKAPTLLDHEQGFQLLDRNSANTKAVGIFGFKVGSHQLYAPVFFLRGELKGHELLYIKNQDLFVPLKENWLNYLLNRKPHILGEGVTRSTAQMGVLQPDLNRLSQSPYKYASAVDPSIASFLPKYAWLSLPENFKRELDAFGNHCRERLDLSHFLKQASLPMLEHLVDTCRQYPRFGATIAKYHGVDALSESIKTAGVRHRNGDNSILAGPPPRKPMRTGLHTGSILTEKRADDQAKQKVTVVYHDASRTEHPKLDMTEEESEKLLQDGSLIKDEREGEEVSVPYNVQVEKKLFNPSETGLYEVLVKPGSFERCYVCINPHGANGRKSFATLVRIGEDKPAWCNCDANALWASAKVADEEYDKWYDGLTEVDTLSKGKSRCILVGPRGNGTLPFRVEKHHGSGEGEKIYDVDFSDHCQHTNELGARRGYGRYGHYGDDEDYSPWSDGQRIHVDGKDGTQLRSNRGDMFVPKGYKKLMVEPTEEDKKSDSDDDSVCGCAPSMPGGRSDDPPLIPGNLLDAELAVMTKTSALKVFHDGQEVTLNDGGPMRPRAAVIELVVMHGLREKAAHTIIKTAQIRHARMEGAYNIRVKYASPYLTEQGPSAPSMPEPSMGGYNVMGFQGPTQPSFQQEVAVPGMSGRDTDPNVYNGNPDNTPDPMDMQNIQGAMDSGQKEIFDVSVIGGMLKAVRDDTMIDRYLPDLIKGCDRLGRLLFMFYWHGDKFADRYGKMDMPELEDSLRNAFEMTGDVVLFLKQKTVEADPEMDDIDLNLSDTAEM